jgi:hypothetical protein
MPNLVLIAPIRLFRNQYVLLLGSVEAELALLPSLTAETISNKCSFACLAISTTNAAFIRQKP